MKTLRNIALFIIAFGIFLGIRYIGSVIHYGCHQERIVNTEDGDDCAPPIEGVGEIGFYLTGGSLNPLFNRDEETVRTVSWKIEKANPSITDQDDFRFYEQKISADVTTYDNKTKSYGLGSAYGCTGTTTSELEARTIVIGRVRCDFAESGTTFSAFKRGDEFYIERYDTSAVDGSVSTTTLMRIE